MEDFKHPVPVSAADPCPVCNGTNGHCYRGDNRLVACLKRVNVNSLVGIKPLKTKLQSGQWLYQLNPEDDFKKIIHQLDAVMEIEEPARQYWELEKLASGQRHLSAYKLRFMHELHSVSSRDFRPITGGEYLAKSRPRREWLIAGRIPTGAVTVLFAEGGVGKSLFCYDLVHSLVSGNDWNGFKTKQTNCLIIQTDEPDLETAERLQIRGFRNLPSDNWFMEQNWQFSQMKQLHKWIKQHQPGFVMIDSLTSCNRHSESEEKDTSYAQVIYELRDLANQYNCHFFLLHHTNKAGVFRGTTAIRDNASEVWQIRKGRANENLASNHRMIEHTKSRCGCDGEDGQFLIEYDNTNNTVKYLGNPTSTETGDMPLSARLLNFLEAQPGIWFEVEELSMAYSLGGSNFNTISQALTRMYRKGLIERKQRERKTEGRPAFAYCVVKKPSIPSL